jgi:acyl-CoA hydrolase
MSKAKKVVIEVNENVPYCLGGNFESVHISNVDYIIEGKNKPLMRCLRFLNRRWRLRSQK